MDAENVPPTHAAQLASAVIVPLVKPDPTPHDDTVTAPHASPLLLAEKVEPAKHMLHAPSDTMVACVNPSPATHDLTVTIPHASPLLLDENVEPL